MVDCRKCGRGIWYGAVYVKNQHGVFHQECYDKEEWKKKKKNKRR